MKIVGTIVNESMNLIGCVVGNKNQQKAFSLQDIKEMIKNGKIDNFHLDENGELVGVSKKLSNLKMFTPKGKEISNQVSIKSIIVDGNDNILGAELHLTALNKDVKVKLNDLVKLYNYCEPTNFMLRNRDGKWYITGKGDTKKEDIPVIQHKEKEKNIEYEDKILTCDDLKYLGITTDSKFNDITIPKYLKTDKSDKVFRIVGIDDYVFAGIKCNTLYLPETLREISPLAFCKVIETVAETERDDYWFDSYGFGSQYNDEDTKDSVIDLEIKKLICTNIKFLGNNPYFCIENNILYNKDKTHIYCKCGGLSSYTMPNSVKTTSIGVFATSGIDSVTLSPNLEEISPYLFCDSDLSTVIFPANSKCKKIGRFAFRNTQLNGIDLPKSCRKIEHGAFSIAFNSLKKVSITLPNGLEEIGDAAFEECFMVDFSVLDVQTMIADIKSAYDLECFLTDMYTFAAGYYGGLVSVKIPSTCKKIGIRAFAGCQALENIVLPGGIEKIGEKAFFNCGKVYKMETYSYDSVVESLTTSKYGDLSEYSPEKFASLINSKKLNIAYLYEVFKSNFDFDRYDIDSYSVGIGLESIKIPASCKYIGSKAFGYCGNLSSVSLPDNIEYIGDLVFEKCKIDNLVLVGQSNWFNPGMNLFGDNYDSLKLKSLTVSDSPIILEILENKKHSIKEITFNGTDEEFLMTEAYRILLPYLSGIKTNFTEESSGIDWTSKGSDDIDFDSFEIK